ncbi:hypothetical protein [Swingsia samuiensis]|uniref:Uncharacterized protein n=1 Tax=Swingsia samuiensis TaxID=1293412 RepID=A0A4Y6UP56_9PROT|nr:hypothetical protein [Swingsia samuiensis]QDH17835.1 hypothetical protein E3D00_09840 [Swingsia samuiensis]
MKKLSAGVFALSALVAFSAPAMAKHHHAGAHHHHNHKGAAASQKAQDSTTDDLNSRSLQQAQTPLPSTTAPAAPNATATVPSAPNQSVVVPPAADSKMPAGMAMPN